MKKVIAIILMSVLSVSLITGCSQNAEPSAEQSSNDFDTNNDISVVSREDGSGTRGAFIELFGIEVKSDDGSKKDMATKEAIIASKTDVMMTNIANNPYAIGYISLGSLGETVKALDIDGVKATAENVKNGTYEVSRPFNIATKGEPTGLAGDFISFILSKEGQEVVAENHYIAVDDNAASYSGSKPDGKIAVAGSSSVTPVMEKLKEAYLEINPNATIEIQMSDSTSGMTSVLDGTCDIGMASRALKDSELEELTPTAIDLDGIAVIVNTKNSLTNITSEQVKSIFTGESTAWSEIID